METETKTHNNRKAKMENNELKWQGTCVRAHVSRLRRQLKAGGYEVEGVVKDGFVQAWLTAEGDRVRVFSAMDMRGAWSILAVPGLLTGEDEAEEVEA
jgi:hypothetical protein